MIILCCCFYIEVAAGNVCFKDVASGYLILLLRKCNPAGSFGVFLLAVFIAVGRCLFFSRITVILVTLILGS